MEPKPVVLIVDDAASNLQFLAQMLKDSYHVKVATSGQKALEMAKTLPDLILLDVVMPDMDGYEVCKRLKHEEQTRDIPIIFITAKNETEDEEHGLTLGAVDYIAKPIRPAIVQARVRTHILLKQQYKQLKKLALHDQLTGLYNRHFLMDIAEKKISGARRHSHSLSLILLDIDHFKLINDRFGHAQGDHILTSVAGVIDKFCRAGDIAARIGGEEFVLLLDHCNLQDGQIKAEKVRQQIEQLMPENIKVTASFGVAEFLGKTDTFDSLLQRADQALYLAKNEGRNAVKAA